MPDMLIATPGRLNDHLENNSLANNLRNLKCLIFDEVI
jgi:superfamily II DNA/RNA helicase